MWKQKRKWFNTRESWIDKFTDFVRLNSMQIWRGINKNLNQMTAKAFESAWSWRRNCVSARTVAWKSIYSYRLKLRFTLVRLLLSVFRKFVGIRFYQQLLSTRTTHISRWSELQKSLRNVLEWIIVGDLYKSLDRAKTHLGLPHPRTHLFLSRARTITKLSTQTPSFGFSTASTLLN